MILIISLTSTFVFQSANYVLIIKHNILFHVYDFN